MESPVASPGTLASWSASLSSWSRVALSLVSRVYTLSPTTRAYFEPLRTHTRVHSDASPAIMWLAPHMASLTLPVKAWGLLAATAGDRARVAPRSAVEAATVHREGVNLIRPFLLTSGLWLPF